MFRMNRNEKSNLKKRTIKSLFWKLVERTGFQLVQVVVSLIIARILGPKQYGMVAILLIFISISQVFVQSGLSTALIRKHNSDDQDFSTVFYTSLIIALFIYLILYISAPFIAVFYDMLQLKEMLRVLGIMLFFGAFNSIQVAYISKNLEFKKYAVSSLVAAIGSGIIGVYFAIKGYGAWALVYQQLFNQILACIFMLSIVKWRPKFLYSVDSLKELFSFGWGVMISQLVGVIHTDIRSLVIGKAFSVSDLAFYDKGKQFPQIIVKNIDTSINSVMFPVYAKFQDDIENFHFLIGVSKKQKMKCGVCSYKDKLVVNFTTVLADTYLQRAFFRALTKEGISVTIESNGVLNEKM